MNIKSLTNRKQAQSFTDKPHEDGSILSHTFITPQLRIFVFHGNSTFRATQHCLNTSFMAAESTETVKGVQSDWVCKYQEWEYFRTRLLNEVKKAQDVVEIA